MARERPGLSPRSARLTTALTLCAALAALPLTARALRTSLSRALSLASTAEPIAVATQSASDLLRASAPVLIATLLAAALSTLAQRALPDEPGPPKPHHGATATALALVLAGGALAAWSSLRAVARPDVTVEGFSLAVHAFGWSLAGLCLLAGIADLLWRLSRWKSSQNPTPDERRREAREQGPAPEVKARRRALQRE